MSNANRAHTIEFLKILAASDDPHAKTNDALHRLAKDCFQSTELKKQCSLYHRHNAADFQKAAPDSWLVRLHIFLPGEVVYGCS